MKAKLTDCADCGRETNRNYSRRATLKEMRLVDQGLFVERDTLCKPCWDKQNHD